MFDFDQSYLFYLLIGISAAMFAEGAYLLLYNQASYRKNINRRLKVMDDKTDRESVLIQLRRERGLTGGGEYRLPLINLNQLILQSGVTIGLGRLVAFMVAALLQRFLLLSLTISRCGMQRWQRRLQGFCCLTSFCASCVHDGRRNSALNSRMPSISLYVPCGRDIRCQ